MHAVKVGRRGKAGLPTRARRRSSLALPSRVPALEGCPCGVSIFLNYFVREHLHQRSLEGGGSMRSTGLRWSLVEQKLVEGMSKHEQT
jgi:hypothetical protein